MTKSIKVKNLNKSFNVASGNVKVLKDLTFEIKSGQFTVIYGPSGCGKSTLLHTILGLEKPDSGAVTVFEKDIYQNSSEDSIADFRIKNIGMIYQQSNWVKALNVEKNVALPLALLSIDENARLTKARELLKTLHMLEWAKYHPSELSSGQQQKIALARALITNPSIIIADEPTGNLDFESGEELVSMLKKFSEKENNIVVMVTHDLEYLKSADICIKLFNGEVQKIFTPEKDQQEMNDINIRRKTYEKISKEK